MRTVVIIAIQSRGSQGQSRGGLIILIVRIIVIILVITPMWSPARSVSDTPTLSPQCSKDPFEEQPEEPDGDVGAEPRQEAQTHEDGDQGREGHVVVLVLGQVVRVWTKIPGEVSVCQGGAGELENVPRKVD